jgi:hypothetical protein
MRRSIRPMRPGRKGRGIDQLRPIAYGGSHIFPTLPAELARVVDAWPSLADAIKAGIVAMIKAARLADAGRGSVLDALHRRGRSERVLEVHLLPNDRLLSGSSAVTRVQSRGL